MTHKLTMTTFLITTLFTSAQVNADNLSLGGVKNQWQQSQALEQLKTLTPADDNLDQFKGKTREQVATLKATLTSKLTSAVNSKTSSQTAMARTNLYHNEFNIYQGYAQLIEDYDGDSFYRTFSVTFDADVYSHDIINEARVYAELYLSEDGGDWVHYYTTDNFTIYGESEDDEYEVYTTLDQGYVPNHYDVLIDLYEVGYSDIVATYSSNDSNDLYALPLESSDYDPEYVEPHSNSHSHGGSYSWLMIALLSICLTRKFK
ncbi:hypothetical protein tinsulaeT_33660 [Thalassotalea insulae]|uniref:GlyGly-CTERM sorting domain-containing protein n=1 Tax=Thalassotalea insulae TaxID=2056778 RepID=A0ABQ6GZK0_9GAMM|nr:choice-of-anchor H family protein [Thalassotalea insulae]GLX80026.1 hypothetical protein tinsulaeT_33660 [Thalassotalea insulae]